MKVHVYEDYKAMSRATADLIAAYIKKKPKSLICLASGHSPLGVFQCMVEDVKASKLNLDQCTFVSLDEWLGIAASQKGSCREMMDKDLFGPLAIKERQIIFFDGLAEPNAQVKKVNEV